jgi:hypothetical protein
MKTRGLRALLALSLLAGGGAGAQVLPNGNIAPPLYPQPGSGGLFPTPIPHGNMVPRPDGGGHGGRGQQVIVGGYYYEPEYVPVYEREIIREVPAPAPAPPPPPRKAYALGKLYDSLPGGCMKMIQDGAAYYNCSGDWYRQAGSQYQAVRMP